MKINFIVLVKNMAAPRCNYIDIILEDIQKAVVSHTLPAYKSIM